MRAASKATEPSSVSTIRADLSVFQVFSAVTIGTPCEDSFCSSTGPLISGKSDGAQTITMNEPITVNHLTFYQAGFSNDQVVTSTLSVRYDPGRVIKYIGCAGIVGGIFTMFYMKAYFQKTPAAAAAKPQADKKGGRSLAGAVKTS